MGCSITTLDLVSCLLGVQLSSERTITTPCASLDYRPVTIIDSSRRRRAGTPDERSAHRCEGPSIDVGRSTAAKGSGGVVFRALALARTQCAQRFRHSGGSLCSRGTVQGLSDSTPITSMPERAAGLVFNRPTPTWQQRSAPCEFVAPAYPGRRGFPCAILR